MKKTLTQDLPSLLGTANFTPTAAQIKYAVAWLRHDNLDKAPYLILRSLGLSENLAYKWRKTKGWQAWMSNVASEFFGTIGLTEIWRATYREALKHSAQDRKLILERFDTSYKPASQLDISASEGRRPPDADEARERNRERIKQVENERKEQENPGMRPPDKIKKIESKIVP